MSDVAFDSGKGRFELPSTRGRRTATKVNAASGKPRRRGIRRDRLFARTVVQELMHQLEARGMLAGVTDIPSRQREEEPWRRKENLVSSGRTTSPSDSDIGSSSSTVRADEILDSLLRS